MAAWPVVKIYAEGDTVLFQNRDYVITNLELGDAVANTSQQRVQQAVTLELTEYKPDVRLIPASKRPSEARPGRARAPQTYRVKRGDTLSSIAKKFKLSSWRPLAALNKISDPRELRVGTVLRVPRP
jgi:nucleoid-associated protein YgaU